MKDERGKRKVGLPHFRADLRTLPGVVSSCLLCLSLLFLTSCGEMRNRTELARRMAAEEGRGSSDERIAELKAQIREVDAQVEKTLEGVRNKAAYWRLLGLKYMDYSMWGQGMDAFGEAIGITPDHAVLHYNLGLCAGQLSLSALGPDEKTVLLETAEASHRRSLEIDDRYTPAMYALSVLLVFELERAAEAIPFLENFLSIERSDINARFVLARAYLETGRVNDALDTYDEISSSKSAGPEDVQKADDLYNRVLGGDYGP